MTDVPQPWYLVRDPEMEGLSTEELNDYIGMWSRNRAQYREEARHGRQGFPVEGTSPAYSAWWAGKILDRGVRERDRRRFRAEIEANDC